MFFVLPPLAILLYKMGSTAQAKACVASPTGFGITKVSPHGVSPGRGSRVFFPSAESARATLEQVTARKAADLDL